MDKNRNANQLIRLGLYKIRQDKSRAQISLKKILTSPLSRTILLRLRGGSMEAKIKHLELIQTVIARMAKNSFILKGWGVTLVSAIFALAVGKSEKTFVWIALFPAITFWILDAYFLQQEGLFRSLYEHVRAVDPAKVDFSMNTAAFRKTTRSWAGRLFSKTLFIFHGTVIAIIIIALAFYCR